MELSAFLNLIYNIVLLMMLVFIFEVFRISWDDKRSALLKYLYGLMLGFIGIMVMLTLPNPLNVHVVKSITLPVLVLFPFGTALLGLLMRNRLKQDFLVKKIKEDERILKVVPDHSTNWECWMRPDHRFTYCSDSCLQITGFDRQSFLDNPELLHSIILPDDSEMFFRHKQRADDLVPELVVSRIVHKIGGTFWFSLPRYIY